ncbi:hypothetical protein Tco_1464225 [Tanacetum coccineum]
MTTLQDNIDTFDLDCDKVHAAQAAFMATLLSYDSDVLSKYCEQPAFVDDSNIELTSESNIISYEQYLKENKSEVVYSTPSPKQKNAMIMSVIGEMSNQVAKCNADNQETMIVNESLTTELERYKEHVKFFKERQKVDLNDREKYIDSQMREMIVKRNAKFDAFEKEIHKLKLRLSAHEAENKTLSTIVDVLRKETKAKEDKYIEELVDLEKKNKKLEYIVYKQYQSVQTIHMLTKPQSFYDKTHRIALGYQNPFYLRKAEWIQPALYDGTVLAKKHNMISVIDSEEILILEEDSRSKMNEKQHDSICKEKKVNIKPIDYKPLNDFYKYFVPKKQLSAEQAFWLPISKPDYEKNVV